jgi:hypothetical protein
MPEGGAHPHGCPICDRYGCVIEAAFFENRDAVT